ncbi:MAG: hypothetical protein AAFO95_17080 [Cyanobacteria bacterium J06600_6]
MAKIEELRRQYLELVNQELPEQAKSRDFPVRFNHCFARIILDNLFQCCWYEKIDRRQGAAYKQLSEEELQKAIALAESIINSRDRYLQELNQNSLRWRGKFD